jgi:hypothetical protein
VDAFHRFVYGFADDQEGVDLWLRDAPTHAGQNAWGGKFWESPDVWIRHKPDGIPVHQNPKWGRNNWFHARVRNRSEYQWAWHFMVAFNVKGFAGTEFVYPDDFLPPIAVVSDFFLAPGEERIVKARWPITLNPQGGGHPCILASVFARMDHPSAGTRVWEQNNLAQRNVTMEGIPKGEWIVIPFLVENRWGRRRRKFWLELMRPKGWSRAGAGLIQHGFEKPVTGPDIDVRPFEVKPHSAYRVKPVMLDCGGAVSPAYQRRADDLHKPITSRHPERLSLWFRKALEARFPRGRTARIPVSLRPQDRRLLGLRIQVPHDAEPGEVLRFDLAKRDARSGKVLGGIGAEIRVTKGYKRRAKSRS